MDILCNDFFIIFIKCDVRFLEPPLCIGVIRARLSSNGIPPVYSKALNSSWRGRARILLHCLKSNVGNSSGPTEEFCDIVFIASTMSSRSCDINV